MGRIRSAEQKASYAAADRRAAIQADRVAFTSDRRMAVTAAKREDEAHRRAQRIHACIRAGQRFGVMVDATIFAELSVKIATGAQVQPGLMLVGHVARDSRDRRNSVWLAWIGDVELPVVYDHDTMSVVTVLPADAGELWFDRSSRRFVNLVNGGAAAARTYWSEVRA